MSGREQNFSNQSKYDKAEAQRIRRETEEAQRQKSYSKEEEKAIKEEVDKKSQEDE